MATDVSSKEYRVRQNRLELECQLCKSSVHRHAELVLCFTLAINTLRNTDFKSHTSVTSSM